MKRLILSVICLSLAAGAFAQEQAKGEKVSLTIQQAVECARQNGRTLKSAAIDLEMKERASKYGWNVLLPTVQVSGTLSRTTASSWDTINSNLESQAQLQGINKRLSALEKGDPMPDITELYNQILNASGMKNNESLHWAAVGSVSVNWTLSLAYIQQIRATKAAYEGGKISWEQSEHEVDTQIRKLFYALLLQQESLKIKQTTLENSRQRANQAQTNFRNGSVPEISYLQAQVAYQNLIPDTEQAERELHQTLDTFAFLLGFPVGTELELIGAIEPTYIEVNSEDLLARYGGNNLDIQALQNSIDQLKMNLNALNLSSWTPALVISYGWQPTLAPYALDFDKWGKGSNWSDKGSLSFTLAWNITNMLPFSKNRQQAADLKANLAKLELTMETLRENQKIEVRKAVDTLNQAREQIDAMGRNVTLAQRAYEMSSRAYRNGTKELLDLRDAESSLNQAKLGQLSQKYNYISALMDLEKALNTGLTRPAQAPAAPAAPAKTE